MGARVTRWGCDLEVHTVGSAGRSMEPWRANIHGVDESAGAALGQARGLGHQVIALGDAGGLRSRDPVVLDGGFEIAEHFEQMRANCVETMVSGKPTVAVERSK